MGPVGPIIHVPLPPSQPVPMTIPSKDANITISNDGIEWSFQTLSDSLTQMFAQQASLNQTLHSHLTQGIQAQGDQATALQQLAFSSHQREYDCLFNVQYLYMMVKIHRNVKYGLKNWKLPAEQEKETSEMWQ